MLKYVVLLAIALVTSVNGQVNVEDKRMRLKDSGLDGSINLSLQLERGNSELTEIGFRPRFVYRAGLSQWFMLNSYSFVETDEASVVNEGFTHLRYNYDMTDRLTLEALTQYQYNRSQDLQLRFLLGTGLRIKLMERFGFRLIGGVTGMYEYEELESGATIETPRNSDYFTLHVRASGTMTLRNTLYVQPAMNDFSDVRILDDFEVSVEISSWLALTVAVQYRYDSEPPAGIKEYDLSLENGLTVSF